jgi:hypothetical protein
VVDLDVKVIPQLDKRLGRQKVHDPRSRSFAVAKTIDRSKWHSKVITIYDPAVNPDQCHGECTGTTKCMQFNAYRNRIVGKVLTMQNAHELYTAATHNDPWPEAWPPDDTGTSGLASCIASQMLALGGEYRHIFTGADGVIDMIMADFVVSVGSWWYSSMMEPNSKGFVAPTGQIVGGHQYAAHGYDINTDAVMIRCWWGRIRDMWIKRDHLNELIMDDGDANIQVRKRV